MAKRSVHHALIACIGHKSTSLVVRTRGVDGQASNVIFFPGLMEDGIHAGLIETLCSVIGYTSSCIALTRTDRQESSCSLAYSRVQVDCDVCRDCSIQDRVHRVSRLFGTCCVANGEAIFASAPAKGPRIAVKTPSVKVVTSRFVMICKAMSETVSFVGKCFHCRCSCSLRKQVAQ